MYSDQEIAQARTTLYELRNGRGLADGADARAADMCARYANGETLEQIGQVYDLTRERVRQVIAKASPYSGREIRRAQKIEADLKAASDEKILRGHVATWSVENLGVPIEVGAQHFEISVLAMKDLLGPRARFHPSPVKEKLSRAKHTDDELLDLLRQFHDETGQTSSEKFDVWSRERGGPTRQALMLRFGKWSEATKRAGFTSRPRTTSYRIFSEEDCWAAVLEFVSHVNGSTSYGAFEQWLRARPAMPSAASIRVTLGGGWPAILRRAVDVMTGNVAADEQEWAAEVRRTRDWEAVRHNARLDIDPVELIRQAVAEIGLPLTNVAYNEWATKNSYPGSLTITRKAGLSWNEVLLEAGVPLTRRQAPVTASEAVAAVRRFLTESGRTRVEDYHAWSKEQDTVRIGSVMKFFDSWEDAVRAGRAL